LPNDEAVTNAMRRIESEGARMARLVDELLLLARLDHSRGVERSPVDLVPLVRDATEDFRVVDPQRPLTTTYAESALILGDPLRLRQVVDNLLANVRTHTPANSAVRVSVSATPASASIAVADAGPGIAAEDRERLFERFWRADPARTRSRGGTGLGLAIVASLVDAQGGTIDVQSEPGKGATFTVTFPLASASVGDPPVR
jgi:two-component system OmpR family sensor kinase